jgi:allantoin racemase
MREVANPDTEIVMRFPRWGMRGGLDGFFHPLTNRLNDRNVYHQIVAAEKEGFDAAITACYYDPILRELRTAVDIPVVGIAEASMHLAAILGYRFGVVSISPEGALDMDMNVDRCGLRQKCVGVISMKDTHTGWLADTLVNPPETLERTMEEFKAVSRQLIARGADVICCG